MTTVTRPKCFDGADLADSVYYTVSYIIYTSTSVHLLRKPLQCFQNYTEVNCFLIHNRSGLTIVLDIHNCLANYVKENIQFVMSARIVVTTMSLLL